MVPMNACFPLPEEELRLHLLLVEGTLDAPADACRAYLGPLLRWLGTRAPKVDHDLRQTAVHEALMNYVMRPTSYDPRRGSLAHFLRMAAHRDLLNLLRREARHHRHRSDWKFVEDGVQGGNLSGREEEPLMHLQRREAAEHWQGFLQCFAARCAPEERCVLELMLAGESRTEVIAAALGRGDLPPGEQEREVKRIKDRLKVRLKREGLKHD
jgi:RNA polymerase sigma-70 factor (ECF subfamily)